MEAPHSCRLHTLSPEILEAEDVQQAVSDSVQQDSVNHPVQVHIAAGFTGSTPKAEKKVAKR